MCFKMFRSYSHFSGEGAEQKLFLIKTNRLHEGFTAKSCATQVRKENIIIHLCKWLRERLFGQSQKYTEIQSIHSHKLITSLVKDI